VKHSIQTEGFSMRLRPVRMDDAGFIVWLRNLDYVKGKVGDSASDVASRGTVGGDASASQPPTDSQSPDWITS
jgi:hypothetical protein